MRLVGTASAMPRDQTFGAIAALAREHANLPALPRSTATRTPVPYVSEPWYCCAEPMEVV
jgi:hypothetical protein